MKCIRPVVRGQPCMDDISCMLSDRSLRCSTSPGHIDALCACRPDTRSHLTPYTYFELKFDRKLGGW